MKIINVCGFGLTGSSAVVDLLREFETVNKFPFELDILRAPGGIIDLEQNIVNNWSLIRSDSAIENFKNLYKALGSSGHFHPAGMSYNKRLNNQFVKLSDAFVDSIVEGKFRGQWHFNKVNENRLKWIKDRFLYKIFNGEGKGIYLTKPDDFVKKSVDYILSLVSLVCNDNADYVILQNFFEPQDANQCHQFLNGGKTIVVDRDIRDSYTDLNKYHFGGVNNIELFIKRSKIIREKFFSQTKNNENVLFIQFEELIENYDSIVKQVADFLDLDQISHINKGRYFNPENSKHNIGIWKCCTNQKELEIINQELSEFTYE